VSAEYTFGISTHNTKAYIYDSLTCGDSGSIREAPPSNEMETRKSKMDWLSDEGGGVGKMPMVGREDDSLLIGGWDGTKVGLNVVGSAVGLSDGNGDGAVVGSFVGSATGDSVGASVVGKAVGTTDGVSVDTTKSDGARVGTIVGLGVGMSVKATGGPEVCTAVGLEDHGPRIGASVGCVTVREEGTAVRVGADELGSTVGRDGSIGTGTMVGGTMVGPKDGSRDMLGAALVLGASLGEGSTGGIADAACRSDKNILVGIMIRPALHKKSSMTR
jgi:hypothetical protein